MNTITGMYTVYHKDGSIKEQEEMLIEAQIGDKVIFKDGSYINDCWVNKIDNAGNERYLLVAGTQYDDTPIKTGRVVKTDSVHQSYPWKMNHGEERIVDMPIAVICDDGDIIYCNPLNIHVIS